MSKKKEIQLQTLLKNFPNLIHKELYKMPDGHLGETKVCLEEEPLPECSGRLDLAFINDTTVYLVEIKRKAVNEKTLDQIRRYIPVMKSHYPNHNIVGYLVGKQCRCMKKLRLLIGDEPISMLIIPRPDLITECQSCKRGIDFDDLKCPYCGYLRH